MSWTKRVEHPSEIVQKGVEVKVLVLDVDAEAKRISLGIKQLLDDPWPEITERFSAGVEPEGSVARVQEKGVVVDLGDDIEGFSPTSHTGLDEDAVLGEYFRSGEPLMLKVLESDVANRRIVLEIGEVPERIDLPEPEPEETEGEDGAPAAEVAQESDPTAEEAAPEIADEPEEVAEAATDEAEEASDASEDAEEAAAEEEEVTEATEEAASEEEPEAEAADADDADDSTGEVEEAAEAEEESKEEA
jgi:small subunit ribosomal protein S1